MRELLRSHSISYAQGLQIALEAHGIKAVLLDEQAPGYLGFAGRVRLAVAYDGDYERAMAVVHALEPAPADSRRPRSWAWQRAGLIGGAVGFLLLSAEVGLAERLPRAVGFAVVGLAIVLMIVGLTLIALGPRRDRERTHGGL